MSFFAELKRRNVIRVAAAYMVATWLLLQVVDVLSPIFELPVWAPKLIFVILSVGFVPVLIFAWAFELTPEGLKREKEVSRAASITHQTARKLDYVTIGLLVAAILVVAVDRWLPRVGRDADGSHGQAASAGATSNFGDQPEGEDGSNTNIQDTAPQKTTAPPAKSIAVLPFVNMSEDASNEYFSDGISEEILNSLAKVKDLKVAGRTSSFAFKGKNQDLRQIGDALGVQNILEGSVRKAGNKVRITAQLIQAADGFHLWSESYDRQLDDVFAIQDDIATAILEQLKATLMVDQSESGARTARTESEVYDRYLLARQRIYERKRFSIESAVELLDEAIVKDPGYAPAFAQRGIAALLLSERNYGEIPHTEAEVQAKLYLDKALQLDPGLAEGWAGLGLYHWGRPGEIPQAVEVLEKALALNPNLIDASNWLQNAYASAGDNKHALAILEDMVDRDPLYRPGFNNAVLIYNLFGQQEKSWALIDRIRPFLANSPQLMLAEGITWLSSGKPAKALPLLESAQEMVPSDATVRTFLTVGLLQTGQFERAAQEGEVQLKPAVLAVLHRPEEALEIARKLAGEGIPGPLILVLDRTGQLKQLAEFVESRWPDLAAFERENPDTGRGYSLMLSIARAYAAEGNVERFNDAMARARAAQDHSAAQGISGQFYLPDEARYYLLSGDREQAIDKLALAVDQGFIMGIPFTEAWPEMKTLSGDPRFEALQARMLERVNAERAKLGLEPLST